MRDTTYLRNKVRAIVADLEMDLEILGEYPEVLNGDYPALREAVLDLESAKLALEGMLGWPNGRRDK